MYLSSRLILESDLTERENCAALQILYMDYSTRFHGNILVYHTLQCTTALVKKEFHFWNKKVSKNLEDLQTSVLKMSRPKLYCWLVMQQEWCRNVFMNFGIAAQLFRVDCRCNAIHLFWNKLWVTVQWKHIFLLDLTKTTQGSGKASVTLLLPRMLAFITMPPLEHASCHITVHVARYLHSSREQE